MTQIRAAGSCRDCIHWTFASSVAETGDPGLPLCPHDVYGPAVVVTENEADRCIDDSRSAPCWCSGTEDCWDPAMPVPDSRTPDALCDPR